MEVYSFDQRCQNRLVSSFDFATIFNDSTIEISIVNRLTDRFEVASHYRHPHKLIVVLQTANSNNLICIVDLRLNIIIHTIEFPFNISSIEVITAGPNDRLIENVPLVNEICCMSGCLAVGCEGGTVFLMDMILDSYSPDPLVPKKISILTYNNSHIEIKTKRRTAIFHNQVICIAMNIDARNKGKFIYRIDNQTSRTFLANQVYISSLHFIPQLSVLAVGYNFGGFHLFNLNQFLLDYSYPLTDKDDNAPVIEFAFQVPENDPKNFSYLWLVKGVSCRMPNVTDETTINAKSNAYLFLLCYQNKKVIDNYGILYDTFKCCSLKFELPLSNCSDERQSTYTSYLLDIFTIHQLLPSRLLPNVALIEDEEASKICQIDYNYLFLAWKIYGHNRSNCFYFCIFDLNQWYKSQMPKFYCTDSNGLSPFLSFYSLNAASKSLNMNSIEAIYFPNVSMTKFHSNLFYAEIHSYPSSMSFTITIASSSKLCSVQFLGIQKKIIASMNSSNSLQIQKNLNEIITNSNRCGLISSLESLRATTLENEIVRSNLFQLMNIALENNLNSLLMKFLDEDSVYFGSDLNMVVEWIWTKVEYIKNSIDHLVKPLFDLSGCNVSQQDISKLVCYESHLGTLLFLLNKIFKRSVDATNLSFDKLKFRIEVVELIQTYLKFILLFENFGLLPDQDASDPNHNSIYSYEKLKKFYEKRREDFVAICPDYLKDDDILLIDILVEYIRPQLSALLQSSEQFEAFKTLKHLYPPPNLSSLLQMFLLDTVPLIYKESILLYFIYDLSDCLTEHPLIEQKILLFVSSLNIQQGVRNFVEGFWFLDHQNYDLALKLFTHPLVTTSLSDFKIDIQLFNKLIQRVLECFLFENQFKMGMMFIKNCNHVLLDQEPNENLYMQILLLNGNLTNAFEFQRERCSDKNPGHLFYKLLFISEKIDRLIQICQLPLNEFEEKIFLDFCISSKNCSSIMTLVLYYVLNNKLIEAIKIVENFHEEFRMNESNQNVIELIEAYINVLPSSTMSFIKKLNTDSINKRLKATDSSISSNRSHLSNLQHQRFECYLCIF